VITCTNIGVVNLIGKQNCNKVSPVDRIKLLRNWLDRSCISSNALPEGSIIAIEHQPAKVNGATTHTSGDIAIALAMYYSEKHKPVFINPARKKSIKLADYDSIYKQVLSEGVSNPYYIANKRHAIACVDEFDKQFPLPIQPTKGMRSHSSDAFLLALLAAGKG
jgi:hypothetical protein